MNAVMSEGKQEAPARDGGTVAHWEIENKVITQGQFNKWLEHSAKNCAGPSILMMPLLQTNTGQVFMGIFLSVPAECAPETLPRVIFYNFLWENKLSAHRSEP